ncbi:hypothetical protein NQ314_017073 [Rhamnusium bicolor]|uniref:Uncharacterized protein n=1 Tax=Rhamnusium bicolor TaxID=1586634 RepID=A0AAV8WV87_9CUCU|nr:hypothetical protein NQ314_017073 [Rhamnusium bicolor]
MKVGGQIRRAQVPFDVKHTNVFSSNHPLITLIIRLEHYTLLHADPQAVLTSVRIKFWPLSGRNVVTKVTRNCISFKVKPVIVNPIYHGRFTIFKN